MILRQKTLAVLSLLIAAVVFMSFRSSGKDNDAPHFKNLQVLPQDISHDDLIAVMKNYSTALGVKCNACHVKAADSDKLDFASDAKEEKGIARKMIAMANEINKNYFSSSGTVGCMTCHNGKLNPAEAKGIPIPAGSAPADSTKKN